MTDKSQETETPTAAPVCVSILGGAVGYLLRRAHMWAFQHFSDAFAVAGLRPADFAVLVVISNNPGLMQSDIAEALGIQRANFVAIVDGLESRGLAVRRKSPKDRRVQTLFLTEAGEEFLVSMIEIWKEQEERLMLKLGGQEERDTLVRLLSKLEG